MVSLSATVKENIQTILSRAVDSGKTSGLVFGATSVDEELFFAHAGPRVFGDSSSGSLSDDSVFWICSQTKLITSVAVLQLIEKGLLQLDTPAHHILPQLANPVIISESSDKDKPAFRPAERVITIKHLLSHSSGIAYPPGSERIIHDALPTPYTTRYLNKEGGLVHFFDMIKGKYPAVPLLFEPGTSWEYGYNTDMLGFIVEKLSGETLAEYFKKHIFGPLGMTSTAFHVAPEWKSKQVGLSFREPSGKVVPWADQYPSMERDQDKVHLYLGGVGLYSTLKDYLRFLRHILQIKAKAATNPILAAGSVDVLFQPVLTSEGSKAHSEWPNLNARDPQFGAGLSLDTIDRPGKRKKGSGAWLGWAGTYYFMDPDTGIALVFGSQLLPTHDIGAFNVWQECERAFYNAVKK